MTTLRTFQWIFCKIPLFGILVYKGTGFERAACGQLQSSCTSTSVGVCRRRRASTGSKIADGHKHPGVIDCCPDNRSAVAALRHWWAPCQHLANQLHGRMTGTLSSNFWRKACRAMVCERGSTLYCSRIICFTASRTCPILHFNIRNLYSEQGFQNSHESSNFCVFNANSAFCEKQNALWTSFWWLKLGKS